MARTGLNGVVTHSRYAVPLIGLFGKGDANWPRLFSVDLFPVFVWAYALLACREENRTVEQFGDDYLASRRRVPLFFPRSGSMATARRARQCRRRQEQPTTSVIVRAAKVRQADTLEPVDYFDRVAPELIEGPGYMKSSMRLCCSVELSRLVHTGSGVQRQPSHGNACACGPPGAAERSCKVWPRHSRAHEPSAEHAKRLTFERHTGLYIRSPVRCESSSWSKAGRAASASPVATEED